MSEESSLFRASTGVATDHPVATEPRREDKPDFTSGELSELPPSLYRSAFKAPYVFEVLGIGPTADSPDVRPTANIVDSYILEEMQRRELPDTTESYQDILNECLKELNLSEDILPSVRLAKVMGLLRSKIDMARALKERQDILEQDPEEMTAKQLAKFLKLKYNVEVV